MSYYNLIVGLQPDNWQIHLIEDQQWRKLAELL